MKLLRLIVLTLVLGEVLACRPQRKPVASKLTSIAMEKSPPKAKVSCESETKIDIIHGTHCWTLRNILALENTDINEISSETFEAFFRRDNMLITYK